MGKMRDDETKFQARINLVSHFLADIKERYDKAREERARLVAKGAPDKMVQRAWGKMAAYDELYTAWYRARSCALLDHKKENEK